MTRLSLFPDKYFYFLREYLYSSRQKPLFVPLLSHEDAFQRGVEFQLKPPFFPVLYDRFFDKLRIFVVQYMPSSQESVLDTNEEGA